MPITLLGDPYTIYAPVVIASFNTADPGNRPAWGLSVQAPAKSGGGVQVVPTAQFEGLGLKIRQDPAQLTGRSVNGWTLATGAFDPEDGKIGFGIGQQKPFIFKFDFNDFKNHTPTIGDVLTLVEIGVPPNNKLGMSWQPAGGGGGGGGSTVTVSATPAETPTTHAWAAGTSRKAGDMFVNTRDKLSWVYGNNAWQPLVAPPKVLISHSPTTKPRFASAQNTDGGWTSQHSVGDIYIEKLTEGFAGAWIYGISQVLPGSGASTPGNTQQAGWFALGPHKFVANRNLTGGTASNFKHDLDTKDVVVSVWKSDNTMTPKFTLVPDAAAQVVDANTVAVTLPAGASGSHKVVIIG